MTIIPSIILKLISQWGLWALLTFALPASHSWWGHCSKSRRGWNICQSRRHRPRSYQVDVLERPVGQGNVKDKKWGKSSRSKAVEIPWRKRPQKWFSTNIWYNSNPLWLVVTRKFQVSQPGGTAIGVEYLPLQPLNWESHANPEHENIKHVYSET